MRGCETVFLTSHTKHFVIPFLTKKFMRKITVLFLLLIAGIVKGQDKPEYGNNMISFTPMMVISNDVMDDDSDIGVGVNYERILNNGLIGIKLPVSFSLRNPGFYYFMPTIKLYPTRQGVVRYAVGPQFYIAAGKVKHTSTESYWNGNQYIYNETTHSDNHTQLGFMINNSFNLTIAKNLYMGMDLGIGVRYFDSEKEDEKNHNNFETDVVSPNVQFSFSMGYRF